MSQTTLPALEERPFRLAIAGRLVGAKPYILVGQIYLAVAVVMTYGGVQGLVDVADRYFVVLGLFGVGVALIAPRDSVRHIFVSLPLLLFVTYLVCSVAWVTGLMPYRSAFQHHLPIVVATTVVASILPFDRIVQGLKVGLVSGILLTVYALVTDPEARIHRPDVDSIMSGWRGSFLHKNAMVPFLVFAALTFIVFERRKWLRNLVVAAALVLTVASQSSTGISCIVAVVCVAWWLNAYLKQDLRMSGAYMALSFFGAIALAVAITVLLPWLVNLYGKDLTFTNRTDIWSASASTISESPWIGYGWNGVWTEPNVEPTVTLNRQTGFEAGHAHNTVLEILLEGGVIGLTLYLAFFGSVVAAAWLALRTRPDIATWALLFVAAQVVASFSEVTLYHGWLFTLVLLRCVLARQSSTSARAHR